MGTLYDCFVCVPPVPKRRSELRLSVFRDGAHRLDRSRFVTKNTNLTCRFVSYTGKTTASAPKAKKAASSSKKSVKPAQRAILEAMAKLKSAGFDSQDRGFVQTFSKNGKTLEGFKKNVGLLKKAGLLSYGSASTLELTQEGMDFVGYDADAAPATNDEFHSLIKDVLPNKQAKQIFDLLVDGGVHDKKEIAMQIPNLDMSKLSGFNKNLSKLSTMGYLDKTQTTMQLTDKCFPKGRP